MSEFSTANLKIEIEKTNQSLQRWSAKRTEWLDESERNFNRMMEEAQSTLVSLSGNEKQLEEVKNLNDVIKSQHLSEINNYSSKLNDLQTKKDFYEQELEKLQKEEREFSTNSHLGCDANGKAQSSDLVLTQMKEANEKFEYLGLKLIKCSNPDGILFSFTDLDPFDCSKPFNFFLLVDERDIYKLIQCEPSLSERVVSEFIYNLNNDNNLCKFVVNMRKEFCKLVRRY